MPEIKDVEVGNNDNIVLLDGGGWLKLEQLAILVMTNKLKRAEDWISCSKEKKCSCCSL
jgi:hypothetical protein